MIAARIMTIIRKTGPVPSLSSSIRVVAVEAVSWSLNSVCQLVHVAHETMEKMTVVVQKEGERERDKVRKRKRNNERERDRKRGREIK